MAKKFYAALVLLLMFCSVSAFALSNSEYRSMMKNSDFARADKELNNVWKRLTKLLSGSALEQIKSEQREWVSSGRDFKAEELIDEDYSRVEAYTEAVNQRVHKLTKIEFTSAKNADCYKHEEANVWLNIRRLKNSQAEAKFLVLWIDGRGSEAMEIISGKGRIKNGSFSFTDNKHQFEGQDFHVTINFDGGNSVSVTTPDPVRFHVGTDEGFEGTYYMNQK